MKFAILIPVHNHLDYTKETLKDLTVHLQDIKDADFSVIVIDDGSVDGTAQWIRDNYPEVILLEGDGNLWWSGAINVGAIHAIGQRSVDYIVLWNNDIKTAPDYFKELVRIISRMEDPVVIGSKVFVEGDSNMVWSAGGYFNPRSGRIGMYGYFQPDSPEFKQEREVDLLTGMGTVVPREVIESIGYWDSKRFPQYFGDTDFTYRAKLSGFQVKVFPSLKIYNHVENSGMEHQGNFSTLLRMMRDIRSKTNWSKNFLFYKRYAESPFAYGPLIWFYTKLFGGFIKWKLLKPMRYKKTE